MSRMEGGTPNPGSREAVEAGCICPVMDNWRGDPELGRIRGFRVVVGCPLHHPSEAVTSS